MAVFTIFDPETGKIICTGSAPADMIQAQPKEPGQVVIEGQYPDDQFEFAGATPEGWPMFRRKAPEPRSQGLATLPGKLPGYSNT